MYKFKKLFFTLYSVTIFVLNCNMIDFISNYGQEKEDRNITSFPNSSTCPHSPTHPSSDSSQDFDYSSSQYDSGSSESSSPSSEAPDDSSKSSS